MAYIIDSREKINIITAECLLCCNEEKCIICVKCDHKACKSCIEQFIISSDSSECFHCGFQYSEELLDVIFIKEIVEIIEYEKHEEEEEEDDKEREKSVKQKIIDNPKLYEFRTRKLFDMEKLLFDEDLKYVTIKQKIVTLLEEYEKFIRYRYEFITEFYNDMVDKDHKFTSQVCTWYNVETEIICRFYSRNAKNSIYTFINVVALLEKLNTKYSGIYSITDDIKKRVEKYHEMNLRFVVAVIILNRHINVLSKCKRGFSSTCDISDVINTDFKNCKELYDENTLSLRLYVNDNEIMDNIKDIKKTIIKCPANDCVGFLNNYKCIICNQITCNRCMCIHKNNVDTSLNEFENSISNGYEFDNSTSIFNEYGCRNDDIETIKLIRAETKKCPSCSSLIYRISGCNQMWCTLCHTGFNWISGKIETNIHNPHYFEWLRDTGHQEEGIIPINYRNHYASLNRMYDNITVYQSNLHLRFMFLTGEIGEKQFRKMLYFRYKHNELNCKIRELLTSTITVFVELSNARFNSMIKDLCILFNDIMEYYYNIYNVDFKVRRYYLSENYELLYRYGKLNV